MIAPRRRAPAASAFFWRKKASAYPRARSTSGVANSCGRLFEPSMPMAPYPCSTTIPPSPMRWPSAAISKSCSPSRRWLERAGFYAVMEAFRNSTPRLKGHALPGPDDHEQIPALAERGRVRVNRFFAHLDRRLAAAPFVAGDSYTIADITAFITVEFAERAKLPVPTSCPHLRRWVIKQSARASAKA
jgi:glutathione S-transferase